MRVLILIFCVVCMAGCIDNIQPQVHTSKTEYQLEQALGDAADDLELGAQVRMLVEKQDKAKAKRRVQQAPLPAEPRKPAVAPRSRHAYSMKAFIIGCVTVMIFGFIQLVLVKIYAKKSTN